MRYCSVHHHTTHSRGDGFGKVETHVELAASYGMQAMAVTEHGVVSSHVALEKAGDQFGVKGMYGLEAYVAPAGQLSKFHATVLAMNQQGYADLNALVGRTYAEGFYGRPTVQPEWWPEYSRGLIITSGCADSHLSCTLLGGKWLGDKRDRASRWDMDNAETLIRHYKEIFGDQYYLEVQRFPELARACTLNPAFAMLSKRTGVPLVATADVHYPYEDDNAMQRILHAAHRGMKNVAEADSSWEYSILLSIPKSDQEIGEQLMATGLTRRQAWHAILNTEEIAERCTVRLPKSEKLRYPGTTKDLEPWSS